MKKIVSFVLCVILAVFSLVPAVSGLSATEDSKEYFDDGSYVLVGFDDDVMVDSDLDSEESSEMSFIQRLMDMLKKILRFLFGIKDESESNTVKPRTVSKTKYAKYYDKNGNLLWVVYLTAEFSYNGEKANCTKVYVSHSIKDSDWKLLYSDCEKSDNTATGSFTVQQYKLGVKLKTVERTLSLTCDKNGNVK